MVPESIGLFGRCIIIFFYAEALLFGGLILGEGLLIVELREFVVELGSGEALDGTHYQLGKAEFHVVRLCSPLLGHLLKFF